MSESTSRSARRVAAKPPRSPVARSKPGYARPQFRSLLGEGAAEPAPDPLANLSNEGSLETVAMAEVGAVLAGIKAERKLKRDQFRVATDSHYYRVLVFQSTAQADEFVSAKRWGGSGDVYLDGLAVARLEGVPIEPIDLPMRQGRSKVAKRLRNVEVVT